MPKPKTAADKKWQAMFDQLVQYKDQHGDCGITTTEAKRSGDRDHIKLASWVERQRQTYSKGTIREDRMSMLSEIDFFWSGNDIGWHEHFLKLKALLVDHQNNGGSRPYNIPAVASELTDQYRCLEPMMPWIKQQRLHYINYTKGLHARISPWRINKLNSINFPWKISDSQGQKDLEDAADRDNHAYVMRRFHITKWPKVYASIRSAKEEYASTGKPTPVIYNCGSPMAVLYPEYLGKLKDGTMIIMYEDDFNAWLKANENKTDDDDDDEAIFPQPIIIFD